MESIKKKGKSELRRIVALDYWGVINKLLEREKRIVTEHFKKNALEYLEHRGFPVRNPHGELLPHVDYFTDVVLSSFPIHLLYGRMSLARFEREYLKMDKLSRTRSIKIRTAINEAIESNNEKHSMMVSGERIRLEKGHPAHRQKIREIREKVLDVAGKDAVEKHKLTSPEAIDALTEKHVRKAIRDLAKQRRASIDKQKLAEKRARGKQPTTKTDRRRAKKQRHRDAESIRAEEAKLRKEQEALVVKSEVPHPAGKSQLHRTMTKLKSEAPVVFDYMMKNRKASGASVTIMEDLMSKLLVAPLPQRAVHEALNAGFEKEFGAEAMPSLIYCLTNVGNLQRRPSTVESWVKSRCQKLKCQGKYVREIIDFIHHKRIFEYHHSTRGRGRRIAIYRSFKN